MEDRLKTGDLDDYRRFIDGKMQHNTGDGFTPHWIPDWLFDFQRELTTWSIENGRTALFADCGLGKTPMQLVWAENVVRHTNKPALILTPLAVSGQTLEESKKFGINASKSIDSCDASIFITNYERLHHLDPNSFSGVVCDESSIIKNYAGKRRAAITEFVRRLPYRLLCTATAAPNDYVELGTSSEALGYLGCQDMITRFFKQETSKDHLGWGRTKYRLREYGRQSFWRWVCSWSRSIRKPSDYGFDDGEFILPELIVNQEIVECSVPRDGMLFAMTARDLREQRAERRLTINERCDRVAELVANHDRSVCWCHLNDEGDLLEKVLDDCVQVSGRDSDAEKEEKLSAFSSGQVRRIITKPRIAGFGMNWQHCAHLTMFPSHSFEQYYQAVRRCWRFGQQRPVNVDIVTTPGEESVISNLTRKSVQATTMFNELIANMQDALHIERNSANNQSATIPRWLSQESNNNAEHEHQRSKDDRQLCGL